MILGTHILLYSEKPEADRNFIRDVLRFKAVDAGHGWLIFALPPAEAGIHPADGNTQQRHDSELMGAVMYLMCDDLKAEIKRLQARKVKCSAVEEAPWGLKTAFRLPSGGALGLYEPKHPTAISMKRSRPAKSRTIARSR